MTHPWPPNGRKHEKPEDFTLLQQYPAIKARYPSALLLFRVGKCYKAFGHDAIILHNVLGLHLATNLGLPDAMTHRARFGAVFLDDYLTRLVSAGHTIALCDQLQYPPASQNPGETEAIN